MSPTVLSPHDWYREVIRGGCVMCRAFPVPRELRRGRGPDLRRIEGHHILDRQHLRRGQRGLVWDVRNGLGVCSYHHARHTHYVQRIPRSLLPPAALEFAAEAKLTARLDHDYPLR